MALAPRPSRLPSIAALDLLACVVRRGGYAAAALDKGVTAGAVRARLRGLETRLGVALFRAHARGVVPTEAALALAQGLETPLVTLRGLGAHPPLDALPGFDAAVRRGGFAAAGADLGLSPGALAAQVRAVERWQDRALFRRGPRGVTPLPEAQALQAAIAPALARLARALEGVAGSTVRIAALPAVAQLWLAPRLPALRAAFPGVSLSITAMEHPPPGKTAPQDLALFLLDRGGTLLARDALVPVCAPTLAAQVRDVADLATLPRLADSTWADDWRIWARAAGTRVGAPATMHSLYALAVGDALAGEGVLIGHRALLAAHLRAGRLVAPVGPVLPLPAGLRLLRQRPLRRGSLAARVAEWLVASAKEEGEWYSLPGSNGGPPDPQSGALTN